MKSRLSIVLLAFLFGAATQTSGEVWTPHKLEGGVVQALAIDPNAPSVLYAGASGSSPDLTGGTIFKSIDGATTWEPLALPDFSSVYALAVDPASSSTIYAGIDRYLGGTLGLLKSSDAGATWGTILTNRVVSVAIDPSSSTTVYAGDSGVVYKTVDGGTNWTPMSDGLPMGLVTALAVDPTTPATVYAGTQHAGVFKSIDGGVSWSDASMGLLDSSIGCLVVDPVDPTIVFVGTGSGVFKSTDGAATWAPASAGLPVGGSITALAVDPTAPATVHAGTRVGVFTSTDGGASWTSTSAGLTTVTTTALAVDPQNPSNLFAGTYGGGVFESTDSGANWSAANAGFENLVIRSIAAPPGSSSLFVATVAGIFKSDDFGETWVPSSAGLANRNAFSLAADPINAGTLYVGLFLSGGVSVYPFDPAGNSGIWKSTDGGSTWSATGYSNGLIVEVVIDPVNPTTIYASDFLFTFNKSVDGGANWTSIGFPGFTPFFALTIDPTQPSTLYGGYNGIWKSTNGALSWTSTGILPPGRMLAIVVDPVQPDTVYVAPEASGVFRTQDGGASWASVNNGLTDSTVLSLVIDPDDTKVLYAGTKTQGVFTTIDGGETWSPLGEGLESEPVYALLLRSETPRRVYAGGERNRIFEIEADSVVPPDGECSPVPMTTCVEPPKAVLNLHYQPGGGYPRRKVKWKASGSGPSPSLGDPTTTTGYFACLYDVNGLLWEFDPPVGNFWSTKSQGGKTKLQYRDKTGDSDGVTQVKVTDFDASVRFSARGVGVPDLPIPFTGLEAPLTVQLQTSDAECWSSTFASGIHHGNRYIAKY